MIQRQLPDTIFFANIMPVKDRYTACHMPRNLIRAWHYHAISDTSNCKLPDPRGTNILKGRNLIGIPCKGDQTLNHIYAEGR